MKLALTTVLNNHTFVGCIDDTLALIQHMRDLYLVNYAVFRYVQGKKRERYIYLILDL